MKPQPQPKKGLRYFIISQSLKLASADNNSAPINKISYRSNDTPMLQRTLSHKLLNNSLDELYFEIKDVNNPLSIINRYNSLKGITPADLLEPPIGQKGGHFDKNKNLANRVALYNVGMELSKKGNLSTASVLHIYIASKCKWLLAMKKGYMDVDRSFAYELPQILIAAEGFDPLAKVKAVLSLRRGIIDHICTTFNVNTVPLLQLSGKYEIELIVDIPFLTDDQLGLQYQILHDSKV